MINLNWSSASSEELQKIIDSINNELRTRKTKKLEEAKTKTAIAIRELLKTCRELNVYTLGCIVRERDWDDEEDCDSCFDILQNDVLEDVASVLEGSYE